MMTSRGFTIVEVLVALLMLSVGLLATFSIFAAVTRAFSDSHSSVEVTTNAAAILEQIRAVGCGGVSAGSWSGPSVHYTWETEQINPQLSRVTMTVYSAAVRARVDTFSAMLPC